MQRLMLTSLVLALMALPAMAQSIPGAIPAGMPRDRLFPGCGNNSGRNANTRAPRNETDREREKRERKQKSDEADRKAKAARDAFNNHTQRMENDHASRK